MLTKCSFLDVCDLDILNGALKTIEGVIEKARVAPKQIILAGVSEAADLAIWTALHTKYKIGAAFPIFPKFPLSLSKNVKSNFTNFETQIMHVHHSKKKQERNGRETLEKSFKNIALKEVGSKSYKNNFFKEITKVFQNLEEKYLISFGFPCSM